MRKLGQQNKELYEKTCSCHIGQQKLTSSLVSAIVVSCLFIYPLYPRQLFQSLCHKLNIHVEEMFSCDVTICPYTIKLLQINGQDIASQPTVLSFKY